jgi:hypothetical protein|nr:hypothetical protein [Panacagrimonas sp.]
MWFLIGLAAFAAITGFLFKHKSRPTWFGQSWNAGGERAQYEIKRNKGRIVEVRFGMPAHADLNFTLRPERAYDRFAKLLTLAAEYQVGEDAFDRAVYILGDSDVVCRSLLGDVRLREDLRNLIAGGREIKLRVTHVHAASGRLWVCMKPMQTATDDDVHAAGVAIAPEMQAIAARIRTLLGSRPIEPDRTFLRAAAFAAIAVGLAVNGGVAMLAFVFSHRWTATVLDHAELFTHAALAAIGVTLALIVASRLLLGGTSRGHVVLVELLSFGLLGALATAWIELRQLNIEFDRSGPVTITTPVVEKRVSRSRKGAPTYYLDVREWDGRGMHTLVVPHADYERVQVGQPIRLDEHEGFMGYRWVDNVRP